MCKSWIIAVLLGVLGSLLVAAPATGTGIGNEGCTPGYWKNHTDNWEEATPSKTLVAAGFVPSTAPAGATLLDALRFKGGPGVAGAGQILLRAGVAAYLNALHDGLGYPLRRGAIRRMVNTAIASGSRAEMLAVATKLDNLNNLGCPLN